MPGYDGLALAMYDTNDQSFTNKGADNFFSITISEGTTVSSGYIQPFYSKVTIATGGSVSDQVSLFAGDFFVAGTAAAEMSGAYFYFAPVGTPTAISSLQLNGVAVYFAAFGAAMSNRAAFHAYSEETSTYTTGDIDAAFYAYCSAAGGTWRALLGSGGSTAPEYFFENTTALGGANRFFVAYAPSTTATMALRINIDGTLYNIPCVPDSCS